MKKNQRYRIGQSAALICITVIMTVCPCFCGCAKVQSAMKEEGIQVVETIPVMEMPQTGSKDDLTVVEAHNEEARSRLTGKWIDKDKRDNVPIAVMFSNVYDAMPQSAIGSADIVFESLVEGGITRLCCLFENKDDLKKIGPVRSCRTYYLLFANEFQAPYVHFGASEYAASYLAQKNIFSPLEGMVYCDFYRTSDRVAPHNAYTSWHGIMDSVNQLGYRKTYSKDYEQPFVFNTDDHKDILYEGQSCVKFYPGYKNNQPWFEYNEETKEYLRYQFNEPQLDAESGRQLSFKNILVKYVQPNYYENGTPNYKTYGEGKGLYISDGQCILVTWKKKEEKEGPTKYYTQDGSELILNQGKTFICQIEAYQEVNIIGE